MLINSNLKEKGLNDKITKKGGMIMLFKIYFSLIVVMFLIFIGKSTIGIYKFSKGDYTNPYLKFILNKFIADKSFCNSEFTSKQRAKLIYLMCIELLLYSLIFILLCYSIIKKSMFSLVIPVSFFVVEYILDILKGNTLNIY